MQSSKEKALVNVIMDRSSLLRCISEGIDEKRKLEEQLDISRSTLNRAMSELKDHKLLYINSGDFEVSLHGELVLCRYENLIDTYSELINSSELTQFLPAGTPIDLRFLAKAETTTSSKRMPDRPFQNIKKAIRNAKCVKGFSPVEPSGFINLLHDQANNQKFRIALVLNDEFISELSKVYTNKFPVIVQAENSNIGKTSRVIPYGLVIVDTKQVWVCIYNTNGDLRGTIKNNTDAALEWAIETFNQFREEAEELSYKDDFIS